MLLNTRTARAAVRVVSGFLVLCAIWARPSYAQPTSGSPTPTPTPICCLPATTTQFEPYQTIYQRFPARGAAETAWLVIWSEVPKKGLWIEGAWFWRKPPFGWGNAVQVLGRAGLSNIFVPYHNSDPSLPFPYNRLLDMLFGELLGAIPQDTGDCGTITEPLVPSAIGNSSRRVLIKEIRDRGVAWTSDRRTRRGEEMLLWATYDAGNYENIIQYGFRDDGTVTFRLGNTGYVSPLMPFVAHTHDALWYVDINLGGAAHNSVMLMRHVEPSGSWGATDPMTSFNGGFEGFADWNDKEFTHVNIASTLIKNSQGNNISYDLMPIRSGTSRHLEDFSQHDFWVTLKKPNEVEYAFGFEGWNANHYLLPAPEPIVDTDVVLWHMSSNHHMPRDEDHEFAQPVRLPGVALSMWSGFDLHPRNLFDDTPLHEPPCAIVPPGLVGWWPLDDTGVPGTIVADIDASGNPAPIVGTPKPSALGAGGPVPVPGVVAGALSFDGQDDYVEIPNNPALNFGTGDFSIDAWIKTTQNAGVVVILDKRRSGPYQGYHVFLSNGNLFLQLAVSTFLGNTFNNYPANAFVADGNWHHIAVAVNRTSNPFTIKWYVDGIETSTPTTAPGGSLDNPAPLRLGVRSFSLGGFWKGTLDELELFNRALSEGEVYAIFAAGRNGKCR